jgi:hypothetical protein
MHIIIKTIDNTLDIELEQDSTILQLKKKIEELEEIPVIRQTLVLDRKLLVDSDTLKSSNINDNDLIYVFLALHTK